MKHAHYRHVYARTSINSLPVELLEAVFLFAIGAEDKAEESINLGTLMPLRVSQTCSSWRNVPILWSTITYLIDGSDCGYQPDKEELPVKLKSLLNILGLYFERSRDAPLYLSVLPWEGYSIENQEWESPECSDGDMMILCDVLRPSKARWRSFHFGVGYFYAFSTCGFDLDDDDADFTYFPDLETLVVDGLSIEAPLDWSTKWKPSMPKLKLIEFAEGTRFYPDELPNILWKNVTSCRLWQPLPMHFIAISADGTSAIENIVSGIDTVWWEPGDAGELVGKEASFPSLRSLAFVDIWDRPSMGSNEIPELAPVIDILNAPSLSRFAFESEGRTLQRLWPHTSFISLLQRSHCGIGILHFTLKKLVVKDHELIECLREMPSLRSLTCSNLPGCITEAFVGKLGEMDSGSSRMALVPDLQSLSLHEMAVFGSKKGDALWSQMVERRKGSLAYVDLQFRRMDPDIGRKLASGQCGVPVSITFR